MVTGPHVRSEPVDVLGLSGFDATVAQERKPVLKSVGDIIVLDPWIFDGLQEMNSLFHSKSATAVAGELSKVIVKKGHTEPGQR